MKVIQVMGGNEEGGLEKHFIELCNGLADYCELIAIAHPKYQPRFNSRVTFHALDLNKSRRNPLLLWQLYRLISKHKPDIVHAQANKAIAMIATLHHYIHAKTVATVHGQKKNLRATRHFDLTIGVSHFLTSRIQSSNKKTIYNGIAMPHVQTHLAQSAFFSTQTPEQKLVLAVGRLVPEKGFDILLEAWKTIDAKLLIAGEGPEQQKLQRFIDQHEGMSKRVKLLGHRNDIPDLIHLADLVVISSRREGFSYVFAEALLLQTPVIASNVPIANEVLSDEFIVPTESAKALAALITRSLAKGDKLKNEYMPFFDYAKQNLTLDQLVRNTLSAYQDLCAK